MKEVFESTMAFQHFKKVMKQVITVPKERLDELVQQSREKRPKPSKKSKRSRKTVI